MCANWRLMLKEKKEVKKKLLREKRKEFRQTDTRFKEREREAVGPDLFDHLVSLFLLLLLYFSLSLFLTLAVVLSLMKSHEVSHSHWLPRRSSLCPPSFSSVPSFYIFSLFLSSLPSFILVSSLFFMFSSLNSLPVASHPFLLFHHMHQHKLSDFSLSLFVWEKELNWNYGNCCTNILSVSPVLSSSLFFFPDYIIFPSSTHQLLLFFFGRDITGCIWKDNSFLCRHFSFIAKPTIS